VELGPSSCGDWEGPSVRRVFLARLGEAIYTRFYLTGGRRLGWSSPAPRPWLTSFSRSLSRANAGVTTLLPGWQVIGDDGQFVVVERDDLRLWARPEEVIDDGNGVVQLRVPVDLEGASPGFYCVRGTTPPRTTGPVDRFYWNVRPSGAARLIRTATERLNHLGIPFVIKVIADPEAFGRTDAGLLEVAHADREVVLPTVRVLYARLGGDLDPPTPAFTKALAPGLAFAQQPTAGESFGTSRSVLVAEALVAAYERGHHTTDGRLAAVRRTFDAAGLDLDRPHLAPNADAGADVELAGLVAPPATRQRSQPGFLEIAGAIGRRLCDDSIWGQDRCTWLGPQPNTRPDVQLTIPLAEVGPALYEGTAGIALFLAEVAWRTDDRRTRRVSIGAVRQALARGDDMPRQGRDGLFGGRTGVAVAAAHVGRLLDVPELVDRGLRLIEEVDDPEGVDVMDGRAGLLLGLVTLADATGEVAYAERAGRLAESLAAAEDSAGLDGVGIAHGSAGVVAALDAVARVTGHPLPRRSAGVLRATLPARSVDAGISWCRGLAGLVCVLRDEHQRAGVDRLCHQLREHVDARHPDLSLCHGLFGAADALVEIAHRRSQMAGPLLELAREVGEVAWWDARNRGSWPCGMPGEPPGLMLGLAGVGLGYLRLHDPSVLSPLAVGRQMYVEPSVDDEHVKEPV